LKAGADLRARVAIDECKEHVVKGQNEDRHKNLLVKAAEADKVLKRTNFRKARVAKAGHDQDESEAEDCNYKADDQDYN